MHGINSVAHASSLLPKIISSYDDLKILPINDEAAPIILDIILMTLLDDYITKQKSVNSPFFSNESKEELDAIIALKESINGNDIMTENAITTLSNGNLGKLIDNYLKAYFLQQTKEDFFKAKNEKPVSPEYKH